MTPRRNNPEAPHRNPRKHAKESVDRGDPRIEIHYRAPTTPRWDDVPSTPAAREGCISCSEVTLLAAYISPHSSLREEISAAMAEGGIEQPREPEPVTDEELDRLEAQMHALFTKRLAAEEARRAAGDTINPYHDERHNYQVGQRLVDILRAMHTRPSAVEAELLVLHQAAHHDSSEDDRPHPGVAVRLNPDQRTNEQVAADEMDATLKDAGFSLYHRIRNYGITIATANFWDTDKQHVRPQKLSEYIMVMADLAGYREPYPEWARQSLGVLKERIREWKRDVSLFEQQKAAGGRIGNDVIEKLLERTPATTLEGFFKFQEAFVNYLKGVNAGFARNLIPGGEDAWAWTDALREKDETVRLLIAAAHNGERPAQHEAVLTMVESELAQLKGEVDILVARTRALAG